MKVVILAAGRGARMGELTTDAPKPLLQAAGKSLLEHKLDILPEIIDEVVIIVGYQETMIRQHLGDTYGKMRLTYVTQEVLDGTAGAVWQAGPYLKGRFIVMMGDDLYAREDIEKCLSVSDWAILVAQTDGLSSGGRVVMEGEQVVAIEEGSRTEPVLISTNMFVLDARIFEYPLAPKAEGSTEYGLPQTVLEAAHKGNIPLSSIPTNKWFQVTAPEDLTKAGAWIATISA